MSSSSAPTFELTYFDGRGLAETIRLLFAYAGTPFTDTRIASGSDEWKNLKPKTFFGKLPFLKFQSKDGVTHELAQSRAIERYLAKQFNLYGSNDEEAAYIDSFIDQINDIRNGFFAAKTAEDNQKYADEYPAQLANLSKFVARSKTGFVVGNKITWADIALFAYLDAVKLTTNENLKKVVPAVDAASDLQAIADKVRADSKVAAYVAARKNTPF